MRNYADKRWIPGKWNKNIHQQQQHHHHDHHQQHQQHSKKIMKRVKKRTNTYNQSSEKTSKQQSIHNQRVERRNFYRPTLHYQFRKICRSEFHRKANKCLHCAKNTQNWLSDSRSSSLNQPINKLKRSRQIQKKLIEL